jgi:hypothetical protein
MIHIYIWKQNNEIHQTLFKKGGRGNEIIMETRRINLEGNIHTQKKEIIMERVNLFKLHCIYMELSKWNHLITSMYANSKIKLNLKVEIWELVALKSTIEAFRMNESLREIVKKRARSQESSSKERK